MMLTVNVITYNHGPWIRQCLDSILSQKTKKGFIVRIFDDCSTDCTTDICESYVQKYPDKVFLYRAKHNLGPRYNPLRSYQDISTPYYLYIEGDDYRLDVHGFQKQIDALEQHPECSFCAAKTVNLENGQLKHSHPALPRGIYDKAFVLENPSTYKYANLGTRIVRTDCIDIIHGKEEYFLWDISQYYELIDKGNMYFIDEEYMVYRMTGYGVSTGKNGLEVSYYIANLANLYIKYKKEYYENSMYVLLCELQAAIIKESQSKKDDDKTKYDNKTEIVPKIHKKYRCSIRAVEWVFKMIMPGFCRILAHWVRDKIRTWKAGHKGSRV